MFRRRGFVRPIRPLGPPQIPPALQRANQMMAAGNYAAAAEIFEQFSQGAVNRDGPRAPWFLLQAGRARLQAGQVPAGMTHFKQALGLFAARGQQVNLQRVGTQLVSELRSRKLAAEAGQIEEYLKTNLPAGVPVSMAEPAPVKHPVLPTNCSGCGGPIRADEAEWIDEVTAECPYCGSAVRAE